MISHLLCSRSTPRETLYYTISMNLVFTQPSLHSPISSVLYMPLAPDTHDSRPLLAGLRFIQVGLPPPGEALAAAAAAGAATHLWADEHGGA